VIESMLRLTLFSHLQVMDDAATLTPELRPRARRLLAYLLLHRQRPLTRESVAFTLWPDQSEKEALGTLRRALSDLRAVLPKSDKHDWIAVTRGELRWNPEADYWLDIEAFERMSREAKPAALEDATTLYTGPLLADWYDDWALIERERFSQMLAETLERLSLLLEDERDYRSAIRHAQRLLRHDPLREETYRRLIHLYAHTGDRTGAVRVYQTCVAVFKRELDADVSPATRAAFEQLMNTEPPSAQAETRSPTSRTHNLPIELTAFIGREREMAAVKELLQRNRLLTLTGPGGCGKTRLALRLAADRVGAMKDGVWLVDLASLSDPKLVPQAAASALSVREQAGRTLLDTLTDYLESKQVLLVLDNCEHVLAACAQFAQALLRACAGLRILATSRERLKVPGEAAWPVPSLSLPAADLPAQLDDLRQSEAIRLFVDRAASVLPTFRLGPDNAAPIAQICQRLDGIPLAIELAAARVRMLSVVEIAARLDDVFRLLTGGSQVAPPRQQTLRATMDWSYRMLAEHEQALFRRLSVFAGGWSLPAAEQVCADAGLEASEVLEVLSQLIDKSLVAVEAQRGEARYRMLETIRQYAYDKLLESGEAEQVQERHCRFFLKFAEETKPQLRGPEQVMWLNRVEAEHDNLCAVLRYAVDKKDDAEPGLRLAVALSSFWQIHDYWSEGREWTQQALARTEALARAGLRARAQNSLVRFMRALGDYRAAQSLADQCLALCRELEDKRGVADILESLGLMAWHQSDYAAAQSFFEQSLALSQETGNRLGAADALHNLGHVTLDQGHYEQANARFQDSLSLLREAGDKESVITLISDIGLLAYLQEDYAKARSFFEESLALYQEMAIREGLARSFNRLGDLARCQGDDDRAEALYLESLTLYQQIGLKPFIAGALHNLGYIAQHRKDYTQAMTHFHESLRLFQDIGDKKGVAECLMGLAGIIGNQGQLEPAARLFGAAEALRESVGAILWPANRIEYQRSLAALRAQLDEDALAAAWAEGRALSMENAIELVV
jgi:non-specific serine/threonine protein kinase